MPSTQRVALITGCSEPLSVGASIARDFLQRGFTVYATARKVETMKELAIQGAKLLPLDVTSEESIKAAVEHVGVEEGRLDVLVNNAGVLTMSPSLELDIVAFNNLLDVNALGVLRVYKAFAPLLLRTANHPDVANKLPKDRSVIINIGSTGAVGGPWQGAYAASKAAVHALSESMSYELANMGVHVITVKLGATRSAMTANSKPFESRQPNALSSGSALPYWDDIIRKAEIAFTEQVYAKAELPTNVAKKIGDAATAGSPPQDLWVGMGAPIFRYFWAMVPLALRWKMWSAMTAVDMVRRPKVDELLVLPGQEAK